MEEANNETTVETGGEETQNVAQKRNKGEAFKEYFTARRIVYIATFTVLSLVLRFLQFPVLNAVPFLQLDFSDVFILICAYALGPVAGIISGAFKELLYGVITGSSTAFVGEFANIIILIPFILIPAIIYKKHKGIKSVILWLIVACVVRVLWSIPVNLLLNFPAFLGFNWKLGMAFFWDVWYWVTLFNFIKTIVLAVVVMLLYKS
ncbi:MAG: ECF transporter S component, partial [Clostridiales bacterium]|nr:ECF transporter S component [Clostridiales bacterium]